VHRPASINRSFVCALLFFSAGLHCPALVVFCIGLYRSSLLTLRISLPRSPSLYSSALRCSAVATPASLSISLCPSSAQRTSAPLLCSALYRFMSLFSASLCITLFLSVLRRSATLSVCLCSAALRCPALVVFCIGLSRSSVLVSSHLSALMSIALIVSALLLSLHRFQSRCVPRQRSALLLCCSASLYVVCSSALCASPCTALCRLIVCALLFSSAGLHFPALVVFCISLSRSSALASSHLSASISTALIVCSALLCCYLCIAFDLGMSLVSAARFCSAACIVSRRPALVILCIALHRSMSFARLRYVQFPASLSVACLSALWCSALLLCIAQLSSCSVSACPALLLLSLRISLYRFDYLFCAALLVSLHRCRSRCIRRQRSAVLLCCLRCSASSGSRYSLNRSALF
jgi:hypothetical protein